MATIKVDNVTKRFRGEKGLCNIYGINLKINDGEFFCLVGPSNSGKSTLLRAIAGLAPPDEGRVYIDGFDVTDLHPSKRHIAMIFENLALYPNRTGYENITSPLRTRKVPADEIERTVTEVVKLLGLKHLLDRLPATFSGGERQRVAIARALVQRPRVYLFDEPLGALDARLRLSMRGELKRLQRDLGQTMVFATHDQEQAMALGDRIAVIRNGLIQQVDAPQDIYLRPKNKFVAKIIGKPQMNFFDCEIIEEGKDRFLAHPAFRIDISSLKVDFSTKAKNNSFILGIRPTDIDISERKESGDCLPAQVHISELLGNKQILDFRIGEEMIRTVVGPDVSYPLDETKWLRFKKERLHLFDKETEACIL